MKIRKKIYRDFSFLPIDLYCFLVFNKNYRKHNIKRIYFYHIRKTGGSSINYSFLNLAGNPISLYNRINHYLRVVEKGIIFVGHKKSLLERGCYFYGYSHIPEHKIDIPKETFTFTSIRDPVQRVLSHYNMLLKYKNENKKHICLKKEGKWLGECFDDFIERIPQKHLLRQIYMFSENFDIDTAFNKITNLSYFILLENFAEDIGILSKKINYELNIFHKKKYEKSFNISKRQLKKLKNILEPEYFLYRKLQETKNLNNQ